MIDQIYLNFSIAGWIIFLCSLLLFGIAIIYYYRTLPPLSALRRNLLTSIRGIVLVILIFLIFQPVLQIIFQREKKPTVAVIFDNSGSMRIKDSYGKRGDSLQYALNHVQQTWPTDSLNLRIYQFDRNLKLFEGDSLNFSGTQTNISMAISRVMDSLTSYNIRSLILLSDGQFNEGINPVESIKNSPVPLFAVTVGDTTAKKDIKITGIRFNPVMYSGDSLRVAVSLTQTGYQAANVLVRIRHNSKQVSARSVVLPESNFQKSVEFVIVPDKPGDYQYQAEIKPVEDEFTLQNNKEQFIVKVLKSRLKVTLISGRPTFDQRLLTHVLKRIPDIDLSIRTEDRLGKFYPDRSMNSPEDSQDVYFFLGFPTSRSDRSTLNSLISEIGKNKIPVLLIMNDDISLGKLAGLNTYLPVEENSKIIATENLVVRITPSGLLHPSTQLAGEPQQLQYLWRNLPPVTGYASQLRAKSDALVLLTAEGYQSSEQFPLLITGFRNGIKMMVFPVSGFGSWHFQLQEDPDRENFFKMFMENTIRWLVNREDLQKVQINTSQPVYRLGEYIEFSGQVFNDFYEQINDAEVQLEITGEDYQLKDIIPSVEGYYVYRTAGIPSGNYTFKIVARKGGNEVGRRRGKFVMEELELEMQETAANINLMRQLAANSAGEHWRIKEFLEAAEDFNFESQIQFVNQEEVLWNKLYWLILIIVLLSIEWFLRKRWGLL